MRNLVADITSVINDANGVCVDQSTAGAAFLVLDGALVTAGVAVIGDGWGQKISIEGTGNNAAINFTITGTDPDGTAVSEILGGPNNGTVTSALYYETITSIYADGNVDGNVEIGPLSASTNAAVSKSLRVNGQQPNFKVGLFVDMSGTLTYSAQYAYQQPEDEYAVSYSASADWRGVDGLSALTADDESNLYYKVNAVRLIISAYTSGAAKLTAAQSM
jgi:hypothetical protein